VHCKGSEYKNIDNLDVKTIYYLMGSDCISPFF